MSDTPRTTVIDGELVQIPEDRSLANGHVYKIHFEAGVERPSDEEISRAIAHLGTVRVTHAAEGGKNVIIRYNNQAEENA